jgi:hypothetical protein
MNTIYKYTSEGHIEKSVTGTRMIHGEERDVVTKTLILSNSEEFAELVADETVVIESHSVPDEIVYEMARQELKSTRNSALASMVYEIDEDRVIQVRPDDLANITTAISIGKERFQMADNTIQPVTTEELSAALEDGISQADAIWDTYMDAMDELNTKYGK